MSYTAVNPYNGQKIRDFDNITDQQLSIVLDKAQAFYDKSQKQDIQERNS